MTKKRPPGRPPLREGQTTTTVHVTLLPEHVELLKSLGDNLSEAFRLLLEQQDTPMIEFCQQEIKRRLATGKFEDRFIAHGIEIVLKELVKRANN